MSFVLFIVTYFAWDATVNGDPWRFSISVKGNTVTYKACDVYCDCGGITTKVSGLKAGRERYKSLVAKYGQPTTAYSELPAK